MPAASAGRLPLATTARTVAAVGASLLTLAILLGGRVPEAVHVMSRFPDKLLHALTYGMLAGCWCVALGGRRRALAIAMAVATGLLDEWLQRSIPGRHSDVADLVADGVGATIGAWLALPVVGRLLCLPAWLRAATVYFACVFGAGFTLGMVRVPLLEPMIGDRAAQLLEMPLMVAVIVLCARWLVRRDREGIGAGGWLGAGALAAVGVLVADLGVGVMLRGMTAWQVVAGRDFSAGLAYYAAITAFALAPSILARARTAMASGRG